MLDVSKVGAICEDLDSDDRKDMLVLKEGSVERVCPEAPTVASLDTAILYCIYKYSEK